MLPSWHFVVKFSSLLVPKNKHIFLCLHFQTQKICENIFSNTINLKSLASNISYIGSAWVHENQLFNPNPIIEVLLATCGTCGCGCCCCSTSSNTHICGDYEFIIAAGLLSLPRVKELFTKLTGGKSFSKLDLNNAYQQLELDDESRELTTINTTKGP